MNYTINIFLFFFLCSASVSAQNDLINDSLSKKNNVSVIKDSRVDDLLETYKSSFSVQGYRIQIYSDNKKQPARDEKAKFLSLYSNVKAHEIYQQPYFKIRVGDFRTKLEAYKFQKEIVSNFPNSFIVKDEIEVDQLLDK
ncbi:MAG: SPOR domain-containing protein [Flavobacteriales bacterium]|nr:hypothetical protein [Flavobacteriales bacterium]MBX2960538.1 SPOR domain-containing protein [Flavobacteriales bacterium]